MSPLTRRSLLATSAALMGATAGCPSNGGGQAPESTPTGDSTASSPQLPTPVAGDAEADVTVAVYEDYACSHCRTFSEEVYPQIESAYIADGTIRYEFHDFPIPVDKTVSWQAASAARAVQAAADDSSFFTYSKRLFENQDRLGPDVYAELTDGLDVDSETVRTAATEERYRSTVAADRQGGIENGIKGTPTVLVNGNPVQWSEIAYDPVKNAIESARNE